MKLLDKFRLDLLEKFPRSTYEEFSVEFLDEFSKKKSSWNNSRGENPEEILGGTLGQTTSIFLNYFPKFKLKARFLHVFSIVFK